MNIISLKNALVLAATTLSALAFPPAPHHLFYGMVRDEYGSPIAVENAEIIMETASGKQIKTTLIPGLAAGVNYELTVLMDAGLSTDLYRPTALKPAAPFRIKVRINSVNYLPIEMSGDLAQLGKPGQRTHLDLTLGEDLDGDGVADAWERMLNGDISKVNPDDDSDGDGLTNLQEYLAGTYAFDPEDGLALDIVRNPVGGPILEFMAIRGRTYEIHGSSDLKTWAPIQFRIASDGPTAAGRGSYFAPDVRTMQVEAMHSPGEQPLKFYRLKAQ